jgi:hypothetical protein
VPDAARCLVCRCLVSGENFLYVFKGARSAPRAGDRGYKAPRDESTIPSAANRLSVTGRAPCGP